MKKHTNKILVLIAGIVIMGIILIAISANKSLGNTTRQVAKENLNYQNFDTIQTSGPVRLVISSGKFNVDMHNEPLLTINQIGTTLELSGARTTQTIKIQLPILKSLVSSGASNITIDGFHNESSISTNGVDSSLLSVDLSGSSELAVTNSVFSNIKLSSSGPSDINFKHCVLKVMSLDLSGSTNINVDFFASGILNGQVSGFSNIKYSGNLLANNLKTSGMVEVSH